LATAKGSIQAYRSKGRRLLGVGPYGESSGETTDLRKLSGGGGGGGGTHARASGKLSDQKDHLHIVVSNARSGARAILAGRLDEGRGTGRFLRVTAPELLGEKTAAIRKR